MRTTGLSPKVPVQAITTVVVGLLAYFGVDLSPELSGAIAVVIGFAAGYIAPPAPVEGEAGHSLVELVVAVLLILILVFVLLRIA